MIKTLCIHKLTQLIITFLLAIQLKLAFKEISDN